MSFVPKTASFNINAIGRLGISGINSVISEKNSLLNSEH